MTKQLQTGVELIDRQHEEFFMRANTLLAKCNTPETFTEKDINQTLDFIWLYMIEHFTAEEDLMKEYGYPDIEAHVQAHMEFRKKYMSYREQMLKLGLQQNTIRNLLFFMRDWFFKQIATHDMKMAAFLKNEVNANTGLKAKLMELMEKFFPQG